jgi:hypothetical protein
VDEDCERPAEAAWNEDEREADGPPDRCERDAFARDAQRAHVFDGDRE